MGTIPQFKASLINIAKIGQLTLHRRTILRKGEREFRTYFLNLVSSIHER